MIVLTLYDFGGGFLYFLQRHHPAQCRSLCTKCQNSSVIFIQYLIAPYGVKSRNSRLQKNKSGSSIRNTRFAVIHLITYFFTQPIILLNDVWRRFQFGICIFFFLKNLIRYFGLKNILGPNSSFTAMTYFVFFCISGA